MVSMGLWIYFSWKFHSTQKILVILTENQNWLAILKAFIEKQHLYFIFAKKIDHPLWKKYPSMFYKFF